MTGRRRATEHVNRNYAYEATYGAIRLLSARSSSIQTSFASGNLQTVVSDESQIALIGVD